MSKSIQNCKVCGTSLEFGEGDRLFFEEVSPRYLSKTFLLPQPKLCAECRNVRRMAWRNDRTFYVRNCDLSAKRMVSIYPPSTPFPVYHPEEWYSDKWDPMDYGQDIDFSLPFFKQWHKLLQKVPRLGIDIVNCENSDYCNYCGDDKNCYLDIAGEANEDCYYNLFTKFSKNCVDCTFVYNSTLCHECINCYNCYNTRHSIYLEDCSDCVFCFDCKGCNDCLFSINLRNKQYYIHNRPHTKEEYTKKRAALGLTSASAVERMSSDWLTQRIASGIYRDMYNLSCENCVGDNIKNSKNCNTVYNVSNCEDCKYLYDVLDAKDCRDLNYSLYKPETSYNLISTLQMRSSACCMASHYCSNVFYCDLTNNSQDLFGCIGLNHKQYCILNKQYSKDEYERLVPKLIELMEQHEEWGDFFPIAMSPCAYNETVAQEYFPLTKEEAIAVEYRWKDEIAKGEQQTSGYMQPEDIRDATAEICKVVLTCRACTKNYKITEQEFQFYQSQGIPIPVRCSQCRHMTRMQLRNPRHLWQRNCTLCSNKIETTYAPNRQEKIFCEKCYLTLVY